MCPFATNTFQMAWTACNTQKQHRAVTGAQGFLLQFSIKPILCNSIAPHSTCVQCVSVCVPVCFWLCACLDVCLFGMLSVCWYVRVYVRMCDVVLSLRLVYLLYIWLRSTTGHVFEMDPFDRTQAPTCMTLYQMSTRYHALFCLLHVYYTFDTTEQHNIRKEFFWNIIQ